MENRRDSFPAGMLPEARTGRSDELESSADESTAIFRHSQRPGGVAGKPSSYGALDAVEDDMRIAAYDAAAEEMDIRRRKKTKTARPGSVPQAARAIESPATNDESDEGWFRLLVEKYGSIELENKGSVARDHLALGTSITTLPSPAIMTDITSYRKQSGLSWPGCARPSLSPASV